MGDGRAAEWHGCEPASSSVCRRSPPLPRRREARGSGGSIGPCWFDSEQRGLVLSLSGPAAAVRAAELRRQSDGLAQGRCPGRTEGVASPRQRRPGGVASGAGARPAGWGGSHAEQLRSARARRSRLPVRPPLDDQVRSTTREVYERGWGNLPVHAQRGRCAAAVPRANRGPARGRCRRAGLRGRVSGLGEDPWASRGGVG